MNDKIVKRKSIKHDYPMIFRKENHHNHKIIKTEKGTLRWERNENVRELVDIIGLNKIIELFYALGFDKNSEPYRKLYRDIGYSIHGYWEVFYWDMNNEDAENYRK